MKHLKHSASLVLLAAFSACNSGNLSVTPETPAATAPATATDGPNPPAANNVGTATNGTHGGTAASDANIFFERVEVQAGSIDELVAVSYSATDSDETTPMGLSLKSPLKFSPSSILVTPTLDDGSVVFLQSNGLMSSSLVQADLSTYVTSSLYDFSAPVLAASASVNGKLIAWADESADVSITNYSDGSSQQLVTNSSDPAIRVQLSTDGSTLLARTADNNAVVYVAGRGSWKQTLNVSSVTAAALTSDGSQLAYVTSDAKLSTVPSAGSAAATAVATLDSSSVYDLSWDGNSTLTYWTRLPEASGGGEEIRSFDLSKRSAPKTLARVSVPSNVTDGVVCPTWQSDTLYFANFSQGTYAIMRTRNSAVSAFAVSTTQDEGFICPSAVAVRGAK